MSYESEKLIAQIENTSVENLNNISIKELAIEGKTRDQLIKVRVNQSFFRKTIMASYNNTCCITGIQQPELLIAGHIKPWGVDEKNRLNPRNGIALNALHDKAFENGLITISQSFKVKISSILKKKIKEQTVRDFFLCYENQTIILPSKFLPDKELLKYHNEQRFKE